MNQDSGPLKDSEMGKSHNPEPQTGLDRLKYRLYRPGFLVSLFVVIFGLLALAIGVLLSSETPEPTVIAGSTPEVLQAVAPDSATTPRLYEEAFGSTLEEQVRQVDFALLETLRQSNVDMKSLKLSDVQVREHEGQTYHYQELHIPDVRNRDKFLLVLQSHLGARAPEAFLTGEDTNAITITVASVATHSIYLDMTVPVPTYPAIKGPKMVIVIDDVGENLAVLKGLLELDFPLVYAVWPVGSHTPESIRLIRKTEGDLIVHYPMEPKGYPKVDPGQGALYAAMSSKEIRRTLGKYLKLVPGAIGANNHMGSRFTESGPGMKTALSVFGDRGLFFLDSMTTPDSAGRKAARAVGIPFYKRDVFLDNVKEVPAIIHQLRKTERIAKRRGKAIAIGHNYSVTLSALRQWNDLRDPAVNIIPISRLKPQ